MPRKFLSLFVLALLLVACGEATPSATPIPTMAELTPSPEAVAPTEGVELAPEGTAPPEATIAPPETPPPAATATTDAVAAALTVPAGYRAQTVVEGLQGPTQMLIGPDGRLWVAQLAGAENAGRGQVVAVNLDDGSQEVLLDNIEKPTGIALLEGALWVQAGNSLLRAPLEGTRVGEPETVLSDLPNNGRSLGTLTVSPAGTLLYETSGRRSGNEASEGSGTLWALDPADPTNPRPLATGLKGAYAHTFDAEGRLWSTEIGDDPVNGRPPPDELNWIVEGADFGWPACFGMQEAATNYGGTPEQCATTRAPVALFAERATPVDVVPSPWEEDTLLVALWGPGDTRVVQVSVRVEGDNASGEVDSFIEGIEHPQALLVLEAGGLLVADFGSGRIYRLDQVS